MSYEMNEEVAALWAVNHAVGDYLLGLEYPEFAAENGGVEKLFEAMKAAYDKFELEFNTLEEPNA